MHLLGNTRHHLVSPWLCPHQVALSTRLPRAHGWGAAVAVTERSGALSGVTQPHIQGVGGQDSADPNYFSNKKPSA